MRPFVSLISYATVNEDNNPSETKMIKMFYGEYLILKSKNLKFLSLYDAFMFRDVTIEILLGGNLFALNL